MNTVTLIYLSVIMVLIYMLYRNKKVTEFFYKWNMAVYKSRKNIIEKQRSCMNSEYIFLEAGYNFLEADYNKHTYNQLFYNTFNMTQKEAVFKIWKSIKVKDIDKYNLVIKYLENKDWFNEKLL